MSTTLRNYQSELDAAGKDLAAFTAMRKDLNRIITRLEKRLIAIDKAKTAPLRKTMMTQISIGIEKAATTRSGLDDQIAYMQHIVTAIKRHKRGLS
jgi:hypothetical protein